MSLSSSLSTKHYTARFYIMLFCQILILRIYISVYLIYVKLSFISRNYDSFVHFILTHDAFFYRVSCLFHPDFCEIPSSVCHARLGCSRDDGKNAALCNVETALRPIVRNCRVEIVKILPQKNSTKVDSCCVRDDICESPENFFQSRSVGDVPSMMIVRSRAKSSQAYLRTWCVHRVVVDLLRAHCAVFVLECINRKSESRCASSQQHSLSVGSSLTILSGEQFLQKEQYILFQMTLCFSTNDTFIKNQIFNYMATKVFLYYNNIKLITLIIILNYR